MPLVERVIRRFRARAWAASVKRSGRISGSPPEKKECRDPKIGQVVNERHALFRGQLPWVVPVGGVGVAMTHARLQRRQMFHATTGRRSEAEGGAACAGPSVGCGFPCAGPRR